MKFILLYFFLFAFNFLQAQYNGGVGDGVVQTNTITQNLLPNIYTGGIGDGHVQTNSLNQNSLPNIYTGGIGDGYVQTNSLNQNSLPNIYTGGIGDGFSQLNTLNQNLFPSIYLGGVGDGFSQLNTLNQNFLPSIYLGGVGDGFSTITVLNQNRLGVLALKLEQFTGNWDINKKDAKLYWKTINETGINYFEIERSIDNGASFSKIYSKQGIGGTNISTNYFFTDINASSLNTNNILYRLKIIENNSTIRYSGIVRLSINNKETTLIIYPNPTSGEFTVSVNNISINSNYNYQLYDIKGRLFKTGILLNIKTTLSISDKPSGTYILTITDNNKNLLFTSKIILIK